MLFFIFIIFLGQATYNDDVVKDFTVKEDFLNDCVDAPTFPKEISGSFITGGPALFKIGNTKLMNMFDGIGRINRIYYDQTKQQLCLSSRFMNTNNVKHALENCDIRPFGVFIPAQPTTWKHYVPLNMAWYSVFDNAWVNQFRVGESYELHTDSTSALTFDPVTLEVSPDPISWDPSGLEDSPTRKPGTAHEKLDKNGNVYGFLTDQTKTMVYKRLAKSPTKREFIAEFEPTGGRTIYMHTMALTENYVIIIYHPWETPLLKSLLSGIYGFRKIMTFDKNQKTEIVVVNIHNGEIIRDIFYDPILAIHIIHSMERQDGKEIELVIEGSIVDDAEFDYDFYRLFDFDNFVGFRADLSYQAAKDFDKKLTNFKLNIDLNEKNIAIQPITDSALYFPSINPNFITTDFCYYYGVTDGHFGVAQVNICKDNEKKVINLKEHNLVATAEPRFIPSIKDEGELDGYLFILADDFVKKTGVVAMANPNTMEIFSKTILNHKINYNAHSEFFPEVVRGGVKQEFTEISDRLKECEAHSVSEYDSAMVFSILAGIPTFFLWRKFA